MPIMLLAGFKSVGNATVPFALISEALLASLFAATLLAEMCADRWPGKTFPRRFAYAYWRYALPACSFSALVYGLVFNRPSP
jgi:hypothetical protein